ncbi:MAG: Gfo/Idh/MocA family protein [Chloroflexota bacterium]
MSASEDRYLRAGVIGAGLIGARRALDFIQLPNTELRWVCDPDQARGERLAREVSKRQGSACRWVEQVTAGLEADLPDLVMIAVPHDQAAVIATTVLNEHIHVHLEKPMGRNFDEAQCLADAAQMSRGRLALGFNYRHYPAIVRAKELIDSGDIGRPLLVRMILGHGGRPGYEQEWKLQRERAGGGALIDPGIHLIDLAQHLLGDLYPRSAQLNRLYWNIDVEDAATAVLSTSDGATVMLQSDLVEWRSIFQVAIQGSDGYIRVDGRMGNYGAQSLAFGKRWAWLDGRSQVEQEQVEQFGSVDTSFEDQLALVVRALRMEEPVPAGVSDGLAAMRIIRDLYELGAPSVGQ